MKYKILIVDDDEDMSMLLEEYIKDDKNEYCFMGSDSYDSAIEMISAFMPDIVITDVVMPGNKNGIDLLKYIKANYPNMKVSVISGFMSDSVRQEAILNGASHVIEKPFREDEIKEIVQ
jgi:DNA-binding NtrC family response regulator